MNPTDFGDLLSLYLIFWSYIYIINSRNDITQLQLYELTQNLIQAFTVSLVDILIILISMHFSSSVSHMDSFPKKKNCHNFDLPTFYISPY